MRLRRAAAKLPLSDSTRNRRGPAFHRTAESLSEVLLPPTEVGGTIRFQSRRRHNSLRVALAVTLISAMAGTRDHICHRKYFCGTRVLGLKQTNQ